MITAFAIRKLQKILYGLEYVFDGLICDHIVMSDFHNTEDGGIIWKTTIHRWHPSYWIGYIRCVLLNDKCGSAYYKREK